MNLQEMTEEQLKAMAYEQLLARDQAVHNLQVLQTEIQNRQKPEIKPEPKKS